MSKQTVIITPDFPGGATRSHSTQVAAPGPYVRNGDFLRLNASSTDASATVVLNGRLLRPDGEIVPLNLTMTITGTGNQAAVAMPLAEGWIVGFIVFVSAGTITDREIVASVDVVQGSGTSLTRVMCLASGEISNTRSLGLGAFTISTVDSSLQPVSPTVVTVANPAAGAEWTTTVPAATVWDVLSLHSKLTCGVAVPARYVTIRITSGATVVSAIDGTGNLAATSVTEITLWGDYAWGSNDVPPVKVVNVGFAPRTLPAGVVITSSTVNLAAADQWSEISLVVQARSV